MNVCCSNLKCPNAGKIFDNSVLEDDKKTCTVCGERTLVPTLDNGIKCSGCRDVCDTRFMRRYYKIHDRRGICCCEGCLARTLLHDGEVDFYVKGKHFVPVGLM
jgi:hypothetical protein